MGDNEKKNGRAAGERFERVFDLVGGHGKFQWRLLFVLALQQMILTWHHIGYAFLGNAPDHWCLIPELKLTNWTVEQQRLISIPQKNGDCPPYSMANKSEEIKFENCVYYDLDYANLVATNPSFQDALGNVPWDTVTRAKCSSWNYDRSIYQSTVATEFNLVCGERWKVATIQGSYMVGGLLGTLTFGSLSDRFWGRRKTVLIALTLVVSAGILATFSTSYWMFLFLRFITAFGVSSSMQNCFILMTEHADTSYRALLSIVQQVPFAIGYMMLPGLAYFLRDWRTLQFSFGLISTALVVYYWILPDSPRWLATHGYMDEAVEAINDIANVNGQPRPKRKDLEEILKECHEEINERGQNKRPLDEQSSSSTSRMRRIYRVVGKWILAYLGNFKNLMKTSEIRKRSLVLWTIFPIVSMVYYGLVFAGDTVTSDPYLLVFLGGLMEVPAYTVFVPFVSKFGRRPTTAGNLLLTGICMLALSRTSTESEVLRLTLAMIAKVFVSSCFAIIYLVGAELYPTELRTTGLAMGIFAGRIGGISAPYIVDLMQNISRDLPTIIFGTLAVCGGFVSLLLPETRKVGLSDKVLEIELQAQKETSKTKEDMRKQSLPSSVEPGKVSTISLA